MNRRRPPARASPGPPAAGRLLDWRDSSHWNFAGPAPCRYCERPAWLLDGRGHPAHKVCAEQAIAQQAAEQAAANDWRNTL